VAPILPLPILVEVIQPLQDQEEAAGDHLQAVVVAEAVAADADKL
jgi:hypothetical protein